MKEDEIVAQLITEIDAVTSSETGVRTVGGDQDVNVPEVVVDWSASRIPNANGHNSFGDYLTDSGGNKVGIEHHTYWRMEADCISRHHSELNRDTVLNDIQSIFIPYERSPRQFHKDTREWEVGSTGPRENPIIEPDWYQAGVLVAFEYVKRADETGKDHITTINDSVSVDESLEDTSTEIK